MEAVFDLQTGNRTCVGMIGETMKKSAQGDYCMYTIRFRRFDRDLDLFWDMATGNNIGTITPKTSDANQQGHHRMTLVFSLAFSPDGSTLAVGTGDGIVDLWAILKR